jgi:hypothetical protein
MRIESAGLENYIKSTITAIKESLVGTGFKIRKPVEFNLAVVNTAEGGGGLKIYLVEAGAKLKSEEISHIKFEIEPEDTGIAKQFRPANHPMNSCR